MSTYPAVSLDDVWRACDPDEALQPGDNRFVDLNAVRSDEASMTRLVGKAILNCRDDKFLYKLVTGHRGSGKTTELLRLQKSLEADGLFVAYADVEKQLDLGDVTYLDVLLVIAHTLAESLEAEGAVINDKLLRDIHQWFDEKIMTSIQETSGAASAGAGVKAGINLLGIWKLFGKATAEIKSASSQREEIRHKLDRNLTVFLELLKRFVLDARMKLNAMGKANIVLIIDGLEKITYKPNKEGVSNQFEMFIHHADQLKIPGCHVVYTVPISLIFKTQLGDAWPSEYYTFPMVKQNTPEGHAALLELIRKRVAVGTVFASSDTVDDFIDLSGGAVRDLLRLVQMASLYPDRTIGVEDGRKAIKAFLRQEDRLIQEKDKERLLQVIRERRVPNAEGFEELLYNRLIHEYQNGDRWADVHPAVKLLLNLPGKPTLKTI